MSAPLGRGNPPPPKNPIEVKIDEITKDIKGWCIPFLGNSYSKILKKVNRISTNFPTNPNIVFLDQAPEIFNKIKEAKSLLEDKKRGSILNRCSEIFSGIFNAMKGVGFISSQTLIKIELMTIGGKVAGGVTDLLEKEGLNHESWIVARNILNSPKDNFKELFQGASDLKKEGFDEGKIIHILSRIKHLPKDNLKEAFKLYKKIPNSKGNFVRFTDDTKKR